MRPILSTACGFAPLAWCPPASACTLCESFVATNVRARLFEADFLANLLAVAAPMPILLGAILLAVRAA